MVAAVSVVVAVNDDQMIEPLHWGSRLAVADDARYTEIAGSAVAVLARSATTVRLNGDMAALATRFDGRPVREILAAELADWERPEQRRVIEILRRLKSLGVLRDVPVGTPAGRVDWMTVPPPAPTATLTGIVRSTWHGEDITHCVVVAGASGDGADRFELDGDSEPSPTVTVALRGGKPVVAVVTTTDVSADRNDDSDGLVVDRFVLSLDGNSPRRLTSTTVADLSAPDPLDTFVALVEAVRPRARLADAGVIELLSLAAERADAEWSEERDAT